MFYATSPIFAQATQNNDDTTVVVKKSDLTPDQLAKIQQQNDDANIQDRIDRYGKWVGLGKEVGVAVNSSLGAITDQAAHFSQTGVGKLTIALVVWKVLGDQFVHVMGGFVEVIVFLPLWIWSYRTYCLPHRVIVKKAEGFFGAKEWTTVSGLEGLSDDMKTAVPIVHWVAGVLLMIVVLFTVFSY